MPKKKKKTNSQQVALFEYDRTKTPLQNAKARLDLEGIKYVVKNEAIAHIVAMDEYQNEISFWANTGTIWFDKKFADSKKITNSHKDYKGIEDYVLLIKKEGTVSKLKSYNNWEPLEKLPPKPQQAISPITNQPVEKVDVSKALITKRDYFETRRIQCMLANDIIDDLLFLCDMAETKKKKSLDIKKMRKKLEERKTKLKEWCSSYAKKEK